MIRSPYCRDGRARIGVHPVAAFDHPDGRLRGPLDAQHKTLAWLLGRSFAGLANRPDASDVHRWIVAPVRNPAQRGWIVDVLKCAAVYPPQLVALVREDALSIHDLATVVAEAGCDYGLLTVWLNKYASPSAAAGTASESGR